MTVSQSLEPILKYEKWMPDKVNVIHGLLQDDTDKRVEFSEITVDLLQWQSNINNNIIFSFK